MCQPHLQDTDSAVILTFYRIMCSALPYAGFLQNELDFAFWQNNYRELENPNELIHLLLALSYYRAISFSFLFGFFLDIHNVGTVVYGICLVFMVKASNGTSFYILI